MADEGGEIPGTLTGKQPVVSTPGQHVHAQCGSVGQLEVEDLLARDLLDAGWIVASGQDMEAVEAETDLRVVGALDDSPRATVVVHEPTPGQGFERDPHAVDLGEVTECSELVGGGLVGVDGGSGHIAADQDRLDAQPLHEGELGLGPAQVVGQELRGNAFEVTKRLVEVEAQAQPLGECSDFLGPRLAGHQVWLEDLDAIEAGCGKRVQLLDQAATEADGGGAGAHLLPPTYGVYQTVHYPSADTHR